MTKYRSLYKDDESYTQEGCEIESQFYKIIQEYISRYPDIFVRDLQQIMEDSIYRVCIFEVLERRLKEEEGK